MSNLATYPGHLRFWKQTPLGSLALTKHCEPSKTTIATRSDPVAQNTMQSKTLGQELPC